MERNVRRGQATAYTGQKDLAGRRLSLLILVTVVVVVHLEFHEESGTSRRAFRSRAGQ